MSIGCNVRHLFQACSPCVLQYNKEHVIFTQAGPNERIKTIFYSMHQRVMVGKQHLSLIWKLICRILPQMLLAEHLALKSILTNKYIYLYQYSYTNTENAKYRLNALRGLYLFLSYLA